jgi:hypothetical protein
MVIGRLYPAARTFQYSNRYRLTQRSREKCSARPMGRALDDGARVRVGRLQRLGQPLARRPAVVAE